MGVSHQAESSVLNWFSLAVMLSLIAFTYWFLVWRAPLK